MSIAEKHCKVDGCDGIGIKGYAGRRYFIKGYCHKHYDRLYKKGHLNLDRNKYEFHGLTYHELYRPWRSMVSRCFNPNYNKYKNYGGRGIVVCDRWRYSFRSFLSDMGERPKGMSLDRIDNDGNYSCGRCEHCVKNGWSNNCRWATNKEQANNRTNSKLLTVDGVTKTVTEWAEYSKVTGSQIGRRVKAGWSHKDAVFGDRIRRLKRSDEKI